MDLAHTLPPKPRVLDRVQAASGHRAKLHPLDQAFYFLPWQTAPENSWRAKVTAFMPARAARWTAASTGSQNTALVDTAARTHRLKHRLSTRNIQLQCSLLPVTKHGGFSSIRGAGTAPASRWRGSSRSRCEVILLHPEYHALLDDPERDLERDFAPEGGALNPFLHLSLHLAIEEQLVDRPAARHTRALRALAAKTGSEHDAKHAVLECLGETIWEAQRAGAAAGRDALPGVPCAGKSVLDGYRSARDGNPRASMRLRNT